MDTDDARVPGAMRSPKAPHNVSWNLRSAAVCIGAFPLVDLDAGRTG